MRNNRRGLTLYHAHNKNFSNSSDFFDNFVMFVTTVLRLLRSRLAQTMVKWHDGDYEHGESTIWDSV